LVVVSTNCYNNFAYLIVTLTFIKLSQFFRTSPIAHSYNTNNWGGIDGNV